MRSHFYAVILAGGSGTRFWPLSRRLKPKQFLDIRGKGSLLRETLLRLKPQFKSSQIFIIAHYPLKKEILREAACFKIPSSQILFEPEGRNTAPAICWVASVIHQLNPQATMAVLPSDHLITNKKRFSLLLEKAFEVAQQEYLVTLGILPIRAETGFGYMRAKKNLRENFLRVDQFIEKPPLTQAKGFLKQRNYFWNAGMFIWKTEVILKEFQKYLPEVYKLVRSFKKNNVAKLWSRMPNISIDYGILEKTAKVAIIPAYDLGWSDLGSWQSLRDMSPKDAKGNALRGDVLASDCQGNFIWASKRFIACIGVKDMMVIDTDDALLICHKEACQKVRDVVSFLKEKRRKEW